MQESHDARPGAGAPEAVLLAGQLTIATAQATQARLLAALQAERPVLLDCRGGTEFDVAFVQLLEAARLLAGRLGLAFHLAAPLPEGLRAVLAGGGFAPLPERAMEALP
jgi:anti-anti-sigma regulatory factor